MADALSRKNPDQVELGLLLASSWAHWEKFEQIIKQDPFILKLSDDISSGQSVPKGYSLDRGVLKYKGRLVIPNRLDMVQPLMFEYHDSPMGGHSGSLKTYQRLAADWFWPGMRKAVTQYVQACPVCQQQKHSTLSPAGLLQPLPIPDKVWEDISLDFVEGLPKSEGVDTVLVVVDRLTKYAHFLTLRHPFTAQMVADRFVKEIVRLHGFPASIVSDRDKIFLSLFWREVFRLQGTALCKSTAYHPQSDGQTEVVNKCLETYLRCFVNGKPKSWAKWIPWAEFWYNSSFHVSTGFTPFKALYGRDPPTVVRVPRDQTAVSTLEDQLLERDAILDELKVNLVRAQHRMKHQEDSSRRDLEFQVGERVFLKLQPFRQQTVHQRSCNKLAAKFYGPFTILQRVGKVAYRLQLPDSSRIHPVFHISQLKKAVGAANVTPTLPVLKDDFLLIDSNPERVLGIRHVSGDNPAEVEVLIKWEGLPEYESTWEPFAACDQMFPNFHLEDKVALWAGGDARNQPKTYTRRPKPDKGKSVID